MKINKPKEINLESDRYGNKAISTTIPIDLYKSIKLKGMSFKSLIIKGYQATEGFAKIADRMRELEEGNTKLQFKLGELYRSNLKSDMRIKELEKHLKENKEEEE